MPKPKNNTRQHVSKPSHHKNAHMIPSAQVVESNDEPEIEEIPQTEKNRFHQRLKKITQEDLAKIVGLIQENCSEAFKELEKGRCQILMDNFDLETFKKAN